VELSFPNKFETYLAAGRPVLFHGPHYAGVAEAVRQHNVGLCVHSLQEEEIAGALRLLITDRSLLESLSRAALAAFEAEFNARTMLRQFAELIGVDPHLLHERGPDGAMPRAAVA
jgi:glycosyltransferase involved in cell wall biosynthesis